MTGDVLVRHRHDHCSRVFLWKGLGIEWGEILSKDSEALIESTKCCG